jgi:hypothetical protein
MGRQTKNRATDIIAPEYIFSYPESYYGKIAVTLISFSLMFIWFVVPAAVIMKRSILRDVTPCNALKVDVSEECVPYIFSAEE